MRSIRGNRVGRGSQARCSRITLPSLHAPAGPEPPAKDAIKSAAQLFRTTATEASTTYVAGAEDLPSLAFPPPPGAAPVVPSFASAPPHAHMILSSGARTGPVPRSATVAALDAASFSTSAAVAAAAVAAATVSSGANRHELSLAAGHSAAEHSQDSVLPPNDGYIAPAPTDELHTVRRCRVAVPNVCDNASTNLMVVGSWQRGVGTAGRYGRCQRQRGCRCWPMEGCHYKPVAAVCAQCTARHCCCCAHA